MNEKGEFALTVREDWAYPREWRSYEEARQWCDERTWMQAYPPEEQEETPE